MTTGATADDWELFSEHCRAPRRVAIERFRERFPETWERLELDRIARQIKRRRIRKETIKDNRTIIRMYLMGASLEDIAGVLNREPREVERIVEARGLGISFKADARRPAPFISDEDFMALRRMSVDHERTVLQTLEELLNYCLEHDAHRARAIVRVKRKAPLADGSKL